MKEQYKIRLLNNSIKELCIMYGLTENDFNRHSNTFK